MKSTVSLLFLLLLLAPVSCRKEARPAWSLYYPLEDFTLFKESVETFVSAENKAGKNASLDWDKALVVVNGDGLDLRELA
ncbi:MAG: hypothetical protein JNM63_01450, partial [Spirochaetia bacterium]|nr:hypothetical protein [Spirochaetia bacterium]